MSNPPGSAPTAVLRPARRVAHAPVPVSQTAIETVSDLRAVCECVVRRVLIADRERIALHFRCSFCFCARLRRPSHRQRRAVLDVVKALAALDPAGFGLDDACAQLEGSTYVMAEEARLPFFRTDPGRRQPYREDLVGAIAHPLRSRIRCGVLQLPLSEQCLQLP